MKGLLIDDSRNPLEICWVDFDYTTDTWIIVRNYDDFVKALQEERFDIISFDHDLDESSTFECVRCNTNKEKFNYSKVKKKTGLDCAKFAKEYFESQGKEFPKYLVHSLNEQGRQNIIDFLGEEKLVAKYNSLILFNKSDEILQRRKSWTK